MASDKPFDNTEDGFTEFQSAAPVAHHKRSDLARAASVDDGLQQESKSSNKRPPLCELSSLSFDESKRMSMVSVASADYFSLDEAGEEEDNISNYSAEFPELVCTVDYNAPVCPNPIEEEQNLFSTPPSSPPLSIEALKREKERRFRGSSSDRSTSNSPRPKSASPLGHPRRSAAAAIDTLLRRSCSPRPKSASASSRTTSSRESTYEEAGEGKVDKVGTVVPQSQSGEPPHTGSESKPPHTASETEPPHTASETKPPLTGNETDTRNPESNQEEEKPAEVDTTKEAPSETAEAVVTATDTRDADPTEAAKLAPTTTEAEKEDDQFDDTNEMFEDAAEDTTSLEESSETTASRSTVSVSEMEEKKKEPLRKSQSANTSPTSSDMRKDTSSSSMTRSATELGLKTKVISRSGFHTRSRSTTLGSPSGFGTRPRRSLEEAPNRSKDEDYFTKLIQKTDTEEKEGKSGRVTMFSDQDFADIFRSSLRGSKVPMVRVESADDREGSSNKVGGDGKEGEGKGEGEGEGASQNHLLAPRDGGESPETAAPVPEPVEVIVIPDNISPDLVSL